jgi:hypothetical protein
MSLNSMLTLADGRAVHGNTGYSATGMNTGSNTMGNTYGTTGSTNAGPHSSSVANKMDPRVDSDLGMYDQSIVAWALLI